MERSDGEKLFRRPRVRQFYRQDVLVREAEERHTTWNEARGPRHQRAHRPNPLVLCRAQLFFDLVFVAVISTVGRDLANNFSDINIRHYLLTFTPIWRIWLDTQCVPLAPPPLSEKRRRPAG